MMTESESAANAILGQIKERVEEIKSDARMVEITQLLKVLNGLEGLLGKPATTIASLFVFEAAGLFAVDEFVNIAPIIAAKHYLTKVGPPARMLDEIVKMVRSAGGEITSISSLQIALNRSNDVKSVGNGSYGLVAWYPKRRGRPLKEDKKENGKTEEEHS